MAEYERKVTESQRNGVGDSGEFVSEKTSRVETSSDTQTTVVNIVWYVYGVVGFLLGIRFVLKVFGANPSSGFVDFIYSVTGVLSAPFDRIFGVTQVSAGQTKSVFEPSILVAIIVYAMIAWGITKLITINRQQQ